MIGFTLYEEPACDPLKTTLGKRNSRKRKKLRGYFINPNERFQFLLHIVIPVYFSSNTRIRVKGHHTSWSFCLEHMWSPTFCHQFLQALKCQPKRHFLRQPSLTPCSPCTLPYSTERSYKLNHYSDGYLLDICLTPWTLNFMRNM